MSHSDSLDPEWAEVHQVRERSRLVSEACETVLASLDGTRTARH
jgi:hypothetical protein